MASKRTNNSSLLVLGLLLVSATSWTMMAKARPLGAATTAATAAKDQQQPLLVQTGAYGVCCAFVLDASGNWVTVCDDPTNIPGALPFPNGTVISSVNFVPGQLAQCVGRFPYPIPAPYQLPANDTQLYAAPGFSRCADQFSNFYEGLSAYGSFVVQCTN